MAAEPPAPALDQRRLLLVMAGLLTGSFLGALDQTIVSTALPTIVRDLGSPSQLSWVVTAYLLTSTVATALWGKLSDLFGRKGVYQLCIVVFLVGSALSGLAQNMPELIVFRGLQGIGGGGLMVLAQTVIGDLVPPRDRGRYQGLFGAVFGASSVAGPLLGGFLVESLSWHWVFYVNLPVGALALVVTSRYLPATSVRRGGQVDALGAALVTAGVACVVLVASLGGTTYPWASAQIIGLAVAAAVLLTAFVLAERRAPEAILPPRLFSLPVFNVSSAMSLVVGAAMLGGLSYLPTYLQAVHGASPTGSGLRMLPLMAGLLLTSTLSGQLISRTGRYKLFPIVGSAVMTLGLYLLSTMGVHTAATYVSLFMIVFGLGLGLMMQVMTIAVQNVVDYVDLGAATSGVSFFRSMGSTIGVAVLGSVYANRLHHALAGAGPGPGAKAGAYAEALHLLFLVAVPVGAATFLLSWFLREVPLRSTSTETNPGTTLGITQSLSSEEELSRALSCLLRRENVANYYRRVAAEADLPLSPGATWLLARIAAIRAGIENRPEARRPSERVLGLRTELQDAGYVTTGDPPQLTGAGEAGAQRLLDLRRRRIAELAADWSPEQHQQLTALINRLAEYGQGREDERALVS